VAAGPGTAAEVAAGPGTAVAGPARFIPEYGPTGKNRLFTWNCCWGGCWPAGCCCPATSQQAGSRQRTKQRILAGLQDTLKRIFIYKNFNFLKYLKMNGGFGLGLICSFVSLQTTVNVAAVQYCTMTPAPGRTDNYSSFTFWGASARPFTCVAGVMRGE
jgi:hypothetical protein